MKVYFVKIFRIKKTDPYRRNFSVNESGRYAGGNGSFEEAKVFCSCKEAEAYGDCYLCDAGFYVAILCTDICESDLKSLILRGNYEI